MGQQAPVSVHVPGAKFQSDALANNETFKLCFRKVGQGPFFIAFTFQRELRGLNANRRTSLEPSILLSSSTVSPSTTLMTLAEPPSTRVLAHDCPVPNRASKTARQARQPVMTL
jgi:hypothetical protein